MIIETVTLVEVDVLTDRDYRDCHAVLTDHDYRDCHAVLTDHYYNNNNNNNII